MLPSDRTPLALTLSLSWQALVAVVTTFSSMTSEKSSMKSVSPSSLISQKKYCQFRIMSQEYQTFQIQHICWILMYAF